MQASDIISTAGLVSAAEVSSPVGRPISLPATADTGRTASGRRTDSGTQREESGRVPEPRLQETQDRLAGLGNYYVGFEKDEKTGATIIKVVDRDSGKVLRQIPPDQVLAMMYRLKEAQSLMFDRKA